MSMLWKTTVAAMVLAALGAVAQQRAAARADEDKPHTSKEVTELLQKGIAAAKEGKKHVHIKGDSLPFAVAIVADGIDGKPVPETSKGKFFPHYLVTTKKGSVYKVKFKRNGKDMDVTITKEAGSKPKPSKDK
jgi:hypothetical protein